MLSSINRDLLSKASSNLGVAAEILNIGIKAYESDYYGAAASFIGAIAAAALAALLVGTTA
ncbi:UNVERIFIED_CONTAM: hypothetical protein QOZ14_33175, partial [Pseudomonas aeruginosa]